MVLFSYWLRSRPLNPNFCGNEVQDKANPEGGAEKLIDCLCGDVLDPAVLRRFLDFEVIFYGPPLSVACDGHRLLTFRGVVPSYAAVVHLLLDELGYQGTLVCICPNRTTPGDARWLYDHLKAARPDFGLRLFHSSYATVTGSGIETEPRLKYVELWFSNRLEDAWEMR